MIILIRNYFNKQLRFVLITFYECIGNSKWSIKLHFDWFLSKSQNHHSRSLLLLVNKQLLLSHHLENSTLLLHRLIQIFMWSYFFYGFPSFLLTIILGTIVLSFPPGNSFFLSFFLLHPRPFPSPLLLSMLSDAWCMMNDDGVFRICFFLYNLIYWFSCMLSRVVC